MEIDQEEMQFLGLFGIYKESYKLIYKWRKIFTQITLTLILPLSIIFLSQQKISEILYYKLMFNEFLLSDAPSGTPTHDKLSDLVSSEWTTYVLFKASYFTFLIVFSLLSTSAVVYTVACAYTSRETTFKKVVSVVPKVWKRLMLTFLCTFLTFVLYNVVFIPLMWRVIAYIDDHDDSTFGVTVFWIIFIVYVMGFVYMTVIWQLASVVTVLEDLYGFRAMMKSKDLIKGKIVVGVIIFLKLNFCLVFADFMFRIYVVYGWGEYYGIVGVVGIGVVCLLVLLKMILFVLVVQTVIYFVCKSYHHESIDKSALSEHLEVYLGDYVRLISKDVQMEEYGRV